MDTTRSIMHTDPDSERFVKVEDENLTIWLGTHEYIEFGVSSDYSVLDNVDTIINLLSAVKGDLEKLQ